MQANFGWLVAEAEGKEAWRFGAIHLATAVLARSLGPDLELLSLDDRVRSIAAQMGLRLVPRLGLPTAPPALRPAFSGARLAA